MSVLIGVLLLHFVALVIGLCYIHKKPESSDRRRFKRQSWAELNEAMKKEGWRR